MKVYNESFQNVRSHKLEWMRVAFGPVLIWAIGALILGMAYVSGGHSFQIDKAFMGAEVYTGATNQGSAFLAIAHGIYMITYFIAIISLYINGYRYALLQEGGDQWLTLQLNMRFVKFCLYSLLIGILGGIYIAIAAGIIIGAHALIANTGVNVILGILFFLFAFYLMFRIVLYPVLISIDQAEPIRTSWGLMKGNVLRFIGLSLLIMFTIFLIGIIGVVVLMVIGGIFSLVGPIFTGLIVILGLIFAVFMTLLAWAVNSKMMGLIYQELSAKK
jgi:hypothetical protein